MIRLETLASDDIGELEALYSELGLRMSAADRAHFCRPRTVAPGLSVGVLSLRDEGRMVGTIGYLDVPLRLAGSAASPGKLRWPINLYVLPAYRGKGLGIRLMEATREGAPWRMVIGGNAASIPVLEKTGWKLIGTLRLHRWAFPNASPLRLRDRFRKAARCRPPEVVRLASGGHAVEVRRVERLTGGLPWGLSGGGWLSPDHGVPRDAAYLAFAFGGALARWHSLHVVTVDGSNSGFFVLAARSDRLPILSVEIVDLDAVPGRELQVLEAARATSLRCGDVVRIRIGSDRFGPALKALSGRRAGIPDLPIRISCPDDAPAEALSGGAWRLTYGDHDQYRVRAASQVWERISVLHAL